MNLANATMLHPVRIDARPILTRTRYVRQLSREEQRALHPRKHAEERDAKILRAIRSYRRAVRFHDVAKKVRQSRTYLAERLRVLAGSGRIVRELLTDKDYIYRIVP